jgi:hypothetical protein
VITNLHGIRLGAKRPLGEISESRNTAMIRVVIWTYNRSSSLEKTLESLAQMTCLPTPVGLIVVDKTFTDDTCAVVTEFVRISAATHRVPQLGANLEMFSLVCEEQRHEC